MHHPGLCAPFSSGATIGAQTYTYIHTYTPASHAKNAIYIIYCHICHMVLVTNQNVEIGKKRCVKKAVT